MALDDICGGSNTSERDQIDRLRTLAFLDRHVHTVKSVNEEEEEVRGGTSIDKDLVLIGQTRIQKQLDVDELDDDDFWRKYREERMNELKQDTNKPTQPQRVSWNKLCRCAARTDGYQVMERGVGKFGTLMSVTQDSFVEFVEKENPSVVIIIHLYQTVSDASRICPKTGFNWR